jgi:hypothetical protein
MNLEKTVQELRDQFATFQCASNQEKDSLSETINSLRADLRAEQHSPSAFLATLTWALLKSTSIRQKNHTSRTYCPGTQRPTRRRRFRRHRRAPCFISSKNGHSRVQGY